MVARRSAARLVLRRQRRVPADDRRSDGHRQAARGHAAVEGVLLRARVVARRQAAAASRTIISISGRSRSRREPRRRSTPTHSMIRPTDRRGVVAGLAVARLLEEPRQPLPRGLRVLARRRQGLSAHRRPVRRHLAGVRRQRQVSLLSRQHQLRSADRLARDELGRAAGPRADLPRGTRAQAIHRRSCPKRGTRRLRRRRPAARTARGKPPADPKAQAPVTVRIDLDGIGQRILSLDVPPPITAR